MNYINETCQGCGKKIADGDDIVVCPECGTPQHRECYEKENKCVNEHLHSENYEWQPRHSDEPVPQKKEVEDDIVICPFCGETNNREDNVCVNCYRPLDSVNKFILGNEYKKQGGNYNYKPPFEVEKYKPEGQNNAKRDTEENEQSENFEFVYDDFAGETDGVPNKEIGAYIRFNFPSYRRKFESIKNKKPTFNIGAFLFGYIWCFFRKMYKQGIVFLTLSVCITVAFYNPIYNAYSSLTSEMQPIQEQIQQAQTDNLTQEQQDALFDRMTEILNEYSPVLIAFTACKLALNLIAALFADRLYKKKVLSAVAEITKNSENHAERFREYAFKGGTSLTMAILAYFINDILSSIVLGVFFQ